LGLRQIVKVQTAMQADPLIQADERCAFHLHVSTDKLDWEDIGTVLAWWIKCETTMLHAVPRHRKRSKFCRQIGLTMTHDQKISPHELVRLLGENKYATVNTYHQVNGRRATMEFRIMDNRLCLDPELSAPWILLCLHFVDRALAKGWPKPFRDGDPWSSFLWLDPKDVLSFLGFDGKVVLCPILKRVRRWLIEQWRMCGDWTGDLGGVWSDEARMPAHAEVFNILEGSNGEAECKSDVG
ncbi:MAG: hypothetical protein ACREGR_00460, partial [Minisyncoccia bacterium]